MFCDRRGLQACGPGSPTEEFSRWSALPPTCWLKSWPHQRAGAGRPSVGATSPASRRVSVARAPPPRSTLAPRSTGGEPPISQRSRRSSAEQSGWWVGADHHLMLLLSLARAPDPHARCPCSNGLLIGSSQPSLSSIRCQALHHEHGHRLTGGGQFGCLELGRPGCSEAGGGLWPASDTRHGSHVAEAGRRGRGGRARRRGEGGGGAGLDGRSGVQGGGAGGAGEVGHPGGQNSRGESRARRTVGAATGHTPTPDKKSPSLQTILHVQSWDLFLKVWICF